MRHSTYRSFGAGVGTAVTVSFNGDRYTHNTDRHSRVVAVFTRLESLLDV